MVLVASSPGSMGAGPTLQPGQLYLRELQDVPLQGKVAREQSAGVYHLLLWPVVERQRSPATEAEAASWHLGLVGDYTCSCSVVRTCGSSRHSVEKPLESAGARRPPCRASLACPARSMIPEVSQGNQEA